MSIPWQVLVASCDLEARRALSGVLRDQGIDPICVSSVRECGEVIANENVGHIFSGRILAEEIIATCSLRPVRPGARPAR